MSELRILVKLPSRGRPGQCRDVVLSMMGKQSGECDYLISIDADDPALSTYVEAFQGLVVDVKIGTSLSKIDAINRDINECVYPWDILVVGSDDMFPVAQGWDTVIREAMAKHYPDTDGMLWFPDGYAKTLCTMPIMGRAYYSRFGHVYNPSYRSYFCDNEQQEVAEAHGKMFYIPQQLFSHRHPDNRVKGVPSDPTYRKSIPDWAADQRNYHKRRRNGFPQ